MKIIQRYINTIALFGFVLGSIWLWDFFNPETIISGDSRVKITAEEIEKMLELNAAKQTIHVKFDTTYTDIAYKIDLAGVKLGSYKRTNSLSEQRTWEVKAGSSEFKIVDTELFISEPAITSCEELSAQREILDTEGLWLPVAMKAIAMKSKSLAKTTALKSGIVEAAKLNVESAFAGFEIKVVWIR